MNHNLKTGFSNLQFEDSDLGELIKSNCNYSQPDPVNASNQFTPQLSKIDISSSNMLNSQGFTPKIKKKSKPLQAIKKVILSPIQSPLSIRDLRRQKFRDYCHVALLKIMTFWKCVANCLGLSLSGNILWMNYENHISRVYSCTYGFLHAIDLITCIVIFIKLRNTRNRSIKV